MKNNEIYIYESPDKSEELYIDTSSKEVEISPEWKFCRVASKDDMTQLNNKDNIQLKKEGYVVKSGVKLRTWEKTNSNRLTP